MKGVQRGREDPKEHETPGTPGSESGNRLEEVLAKMVQDGVVDAIPTKQGAVIYEPGSTFGQYLPSQAG